MCEVGDTMMVMIPAPDGRTEVSVDRCIAPLVQALNDGGVKTVSCCCGHSKHPGYIWLDDGRVLVILPEYTGKMGLQKVWDLFAPDKFPDALTADANDYGAPAPEEE